MKNVQNWLATSPLAQILKYSVGALAAVLIDSLASFHLPAAIVLLITGLVPLIVDYINDADPRFGKGTKPTVSDVVTAVEPAIEASVPATDLPAVKIIENIVENAVTQDSSQAPKGK
jgi:hypothetical protein